MIERRKLELAYLERVLAEHGTWQTLYTPMTGTDGTSVFRGRKLWQSPVYSDIRSVVETKRQVVVLSDPGGGKTATLCSLTANYAERAQTHADEPLPVFIRLGELKPGQTLEDHLREQMGELGKYYTTLMRERRLALLLDGLNELPASNRSAWAGQVRDLAKHCRRKRMVIVVTCRELDYTGELDLGIPQQVAIEPLDVFHILRFIWGYLQGPRIAAENLFWEIAGRETVQVWNLYRGGFESFWSGVQHDIGDCESADDALSDRQNRLISEAANGRRNLMRLASSPYMLRLMIQMAMENGGHLPPSRGALLNQLVKSLLLEREKLSPDEAETLQTRLVALACSMLAGGKAIASVSHDEALRHLGDERILNQARSASILGGTDEIYFSCQLLQEFFVARWLNQKMRSGSAAARFWPADRWWEPQGPEEMAILLAGMYSEDCTPVIDWIAMANPELAGRCVAESGAFTPDRTRNHWRTIWIQRMTAMDTPLVTRAALGRAVAGVGDPRPGVLAPGGVPDIVWCEVPAGRFKMGGDAEAFYAWEEAEFDLPYTFWIAKYPVTYAQYESFVAAGGYEEQRYWTRIGRQEKKNHTEPRYFWNDPKWHIANHPVVGITWQEAYAYTQWLNEQCVVRPAGAPADYVIRLARECEWEKAARYPDGRLFPWGNDYISGYANVNETRENVGPNDLGRTTAVGLCPQGANPAHGACDLSGNVWEFCLTHWAEKYQSPDAENNDPTSDVPRCSRGGPWGIRYARAATRMKSDLGSRDFQGFRVVLSIPIGSRHLETEKKVYADPYHQKEITRAFSTLIRTRTKDAQVIFRDGETGKSVQFLGSAREPLRLRLVRLNKAELERARTVLGQEPETWNSWDDGTMIIPEMKVFELTLGHDIQAAARLTCAIFRDVYQCPPDFQLTIQPYLHPQSRRLRLW
jgi:formylglycine-generating enzyme required for sulfatase activity